MANTNTDYVNFGDVARDICGMQCQYASRFLTGLNGWPNLSDGIRWTGNRGDYHSFKIHRDDVGTFVNRVRNLSRKN
jgi:hypothetical protein